MPKQIVTQEIILNAALEMTRKKGVESVNARSVAEFLGRSVQPIYSYFQNMEELREALYKKGIEFYNEFISINSDMLSLESMGIANIRFAKQESNLFRMLFLAKLNGYNSFTDIFESMANKAATQNLANELKISEESVKDIYIMLIVFTHGIATMLATGGADIADEEIEILMSKAYRSFVEQSQKM